MRRLLALSATLAALGLLGCADGYATFDGKLIAYDKDGEVDTRLGIEACNSTDRSFDTFRVVPFLGDGDGEVAEVICR